MVGTEYLHARVRPCNRVRASEYVGRSVVDTLDTEEIMRYYGDRRNYEILDKSDIWMYYFIVFVGSFSISMVVSMIGDFWMEYITVAAWVLVGAIVEIWVIVTCLHTLDKRS